MGAKKYKNRFVGRKQAMASMALSCALLLCSCGNDGKTSYTQERLLYRLSRLFGNSDKTITENDTLAVNAGNDTIKGKIVSEWNYSERPWNPEERSGDGQEAYYFAEIKSAGDQEEGTLTEREKQGMTLTVREYLDNKDVVVLSLSSDAHCRKYGYSSIAQVDVAFDDEPHTIWGCTPFEGVEGGLAVADAPRFIQKLTSAESLIITLLFRNSGTCTFRFNTAGFEWIHDTEECPD